MKHILTASRIALASAAFATPFAIHAQDTTLTGDETSSATYELAQNTTEAPATDMATEGEALVEEEEVVGTPPEGTIVMQGENTILADDLIGATVFNDMDEAVGDINDIIINLDGTVEGLVIGVGGFLGLGEKPVAISLEQISVGTTESGEPRLMISATREDLEAAERFVTVQERRAAEEAEALQQQMEQQQGTVPAVPTDGSTTTEGATTQSN